MYFIYLSVKLKLSSGLNLFIFSLHQIHQYSSKGTQYGEVRTKAAKKGHDSSSYKTFIMRSVTMDIVYMMFQRYIYKLVCHIYSHF